MFNNIFYSYTRGINETALYSNFQDLVENTTVYNIHITFCSVIKYRIDFHYLEITCTIKTDKFNTYITHINIDILIYSRYKYVKFSTYLKVSVHYIYKY